MTDLDSPEGETSRSILRFSTFGLLLLLTVASIVLAALFGVGRAVGMESENIVSEGVDEVLHYLPQLIVCGVGVTAAWSSTRLPRTASRLVVAACCGLMLTYLVSSLATMALMHLMTTSVIPVGDMSEWISRMHVFLTISDVLWWTLLLIAVFSGRASAPMTPTTDSTS